MSDTREIPITLLAEAVKAAEVMRDKYDYTRGDALAAQLDALLSPPPPALSDMERTVRADPVGFLDKLFDEDDSPALSRLDRLLDAAVDFSVNWAAWIRCSRSDESKTHQPMKDSMDRLLDAVRVHGPALRRALKETPDD